jgi:predicted ArsR family transcriptional regulator
MAPPIQDDVNNVGQTKEKILELLLGGPKTAGEVAEKLRIQKSAARVHLESLKSLGATKSKFQIEKMGRPKKVYELTEKGRELFPRKYDLFLNLVLNKISGKKGEEEAREIVESVADDIASGIRAKIGESNSGDLEQSLRIINDASNEMGFVSSLEKDEKDNSYCIQSKNCILYKVASNNQKMVCHGLHDKIISKSLDGGKPGIRVELKECMALGNEYCRHIIKSSPETSKKENAK